MGVPFFMPGGRVVDLTDLKQDDIDFGWIAETLAAIPRWNKTHAGPMFSVAAHSLIGHDILLATGKRKAAFGFLIHDAHEAFFGDITTPAQRLIAAHAARDGRAGAETVEDAIAGAKAGVDAAIFAAAGFEPDDEAMARVKDMDRRMAIAESLTLFGDQTHGVWGFGGAREAWAETGVVPSHMQREIIIASGGGTNTAWLFTDAIEAHRARHEGHLNVLASGARRRWLS